MLHEDVGQVDCGKSLLLAWDGYCKSGQSAYDNVHKVIDITKVILASRETQEVHAKGMEDVWRYWNKVKGTLCRRSSRLGDLAILAMLMNMNTLLVK